MTYYLMPIEMISAFVRYSKSKKNAITDLENEGQDQGVEQRSFCHSTGNFGIHLREFFKIFLLHGNTRLLKL